MRAQSPFKTDRQVINQAKGPILIQVSRTEAWVRISKKDAIEQLLQRGYKIEEFDQCEDGCYLTIEFC